jgi:hypothetical protein
MKIAADRIDALARKGLRIGRHQDKFEIGYPGGRREWLDTPLAFSRRLDELATLDHRPSSS